MSLRRTAFSTTLLLTVGLGIGLSAADELKVLVFSKTKGFRHDSIETGVAAVKEIGKAAGWAVDATEDSTLFTDDTLRKYRAVVWLNTTGDVLDDAQQGAFERFIKAGGGYAGIHSASDTEYDWPWYGKLVGAYFKSHPHNQKAKIDVLDKKHPSTAHLPDVWERFDEWYTFRAAPTHVKVLLKIDEKSYQGGGMDNNHPIGWYHEIDGGRAFYTAGGHTKESYGEPEFRKHIEGGIAYALGDKPLDYSKAPPSEARFEKVVISREMKDPMQFTILGDGRIVVVDRMGTVHVIRQDGTSVPTEVPIYAVGSGPNWEDGMIGVAADPDFAKNPYVYILHAVKGDVPKEALMRYGFKGDHIDIASGKMILEIPNCRTVIGHCGGGMSFGPDRQLFISTGDNTTPFVSDGFTPLDHRTEGHDARATSANSMDLRGKILRIHIKEDGTYDIPKGNLFPVGTPKTRPEIYVMGNRNPFRHHYDPVTGWLLWGEVGPDSANDNPNRGPRGHDEFNLAKGPGFFGWPLFVGDSKAYNDYEFETKKSGEKFDPAKPINNSPRNTGIKELPPAQKPLMWYPGAASSEFPELGQGGRCAMGGPIYRFNANLKSEDKFPAYFEGKWFIYEWMREWVKVVSFDKDGNKTAVENFAPGIKFKKPMDMKFGPDGALYVLEYGTNWSNNTDSQLSKVVYAGGNRSPTVMATADKYVGKDPLTVKFSSAGTDDKDGDKLTYVWDFGGKGSSSEANPTFSFKEAGAYNVTLTVKDPGGKSATTGMPIRVGNDEPVVKIVEPKPGSFFAWGKPLTFKVEVSDSEDGSTADGKLNAQKIQVAATYQDGTPAAAPSGHQEAPVLTGGSDKGRKLVAGSDCLACHQMQVQSVGPSFMAISTKYHKQKVVDQLATKIIAGGAGAWGPIPMVPHPQHSLEVAKDMAGWILSLADAPPPVTGATGTLNVIAKPEKNDRGVYIVNASYTDAGAKGQPALTGNATVTLRSRYVKATSCTTNKGLQEEDCADEDKGRNFGFIDHDDHISFAGIDLSATNAIAVRFASAGAGGIIEVHAGSSTGPLVAKIEVGPTGGWQMWKTSSAADVTDPGGVQELFFVCKSKSGSGGGLFNINRVHFIEK